MKLPMRVLMGVCASRSAMAWDNLANSARAAAACSCALPSSCGMMDGSAISAAQRILSSRASEQFLDAIPDKSIINEMELSMPAIKLDWCE